MRLVLKCRTAKKLLAGMGTKGLESLPEASQFAP